MARLLFQLFRHVPTAQASLALAVMGSSLAWSLYWPSMTGVIRPICLGFAVLLLLPVLVKYCCYPHLFLQDLRHPLYGGLMAPISMCLLIIADYLTLLNLTLARAVWFPAIALHLGMMLYFYQHQIRNFRLIHLLPSWFLYPVGGISGTLAGPSLGFHQMTYVMTLVCIAIYFVMLPVVLYRLCFAGRLPRPARPTLAIMAAPVNLALAAYLANMSQPDPILVGALAGVAITMTILVYLCYFYLLRQRFQPSIAALTFPSVISVVAMYRLTSFFAQDHTHWLWLKALGIIELIVATGLMAWVIGHFILHYWHQRHFLLQLYRPPLAVEVNSAD
ncbi:hypothetical protein VST7929_00210 [Vibrio stylophorae]|uniref:Tellurium resistance protein n=1 Tax=Vibrio stylophorae TaxID=659351 RepID=A0ABN8DMQ9_9VIBR|nr:TDT family transporter [Vibrio stylophorae]CAH0532381.1 hypothetical protein VST7929_00210 [Vibrio stylophorae]